MARRARRRAAKVEEIEIPVSVDAATYKYLLQTYGAGEITVETDDATYEYLMREYGGGG